jgi:solute carrier family 25 carnitine/acylcarnitine transporter 20/29
MSEVKETNKRSSHPLIDTFGGSFGSMVGLVVGSPFDVVKVRMQNTANSSVGVFSTISETWQHEGFTAFYKGLLPPLIGEAVLNSVWFGTYALVSLLLQSDRSKHLSFYEGFIAGAASGVTGSFVVTPVDLVKVRAQINKDQGAQRKTPRKIIKEIWITEGIWGFRRGLTPTLIREVPSMAAYFGFYNYLKLKFMRPDGSLSNSSQIIAGGTAGALSWACIYPVDVIKTRMQTTAQFKSMAECIKSILQNEGPRAFFQGMSPCIIRSFPVNATLFFVYEFIVNQSLKITG